MEAAQLSGSSGPRGLRPAAELAANKPCGTRIRYIGGCRCAACRRANTRYETERAKARLAGDWNGIVPADRARRHLHKLAGLGVGRRAVHAATDIADSILTEIRSGKRPRIRARTERLILQVTQDCASDAAVRSATRTHRLLAELYEEGYTEAFLAKRLGYSRSYLQFGDRISTRNAYRVECLYKELTE
jgi:hypothetical protein